MLNDKLRRRYKRDKNGFVYPDYNGYSLANVQNTVLGLLGAKFKDTLAPELYKKVLKGRKVKRVLLFFIDGFGYMQWKRYQNRFEFLRVLTAKGLVSPITTVFPSTTAAAVTSANTGTPPTRHSLPEWYIYSKKLDGVIAPLPFHRIESRVPDSLRRDGITGSYLFNGNSVYKKLKSSGCAGYIFLPRGISDSVYSKRVYSGARMMPYKYITDMFASLRKQMQNEKRRALFQVYIPDLDSMEHAFGPYSEEYEAQLSVITHLLKTELLERLDKKSAKDTLLVIIADHGQVSIDPQRARYLNSHRKLVEMFELSKNGRQIFPVGSPRDLFLHIKRERLGDAHEYLSKLLENEAKVAKVRDLVEQGVFGDGEASAEFYSRIGNLAVLPFCDKLVAWDFAPIFEYKFKGHHGGLSEEEMLIPFAVAWLPDLVK